MAIARSDFMNEVYNGGFAPAFSVSITLVWDYVSETRGKKGKLAEKYMWKLHI